MIRSTRPASGVPGPRSAAPSSRGHVDRLGGRAGHRRRPPTGIAGEHLEHHPPERIQVGAPVELGQPGRLLRSDVPGRAGDERQRREVEAAGEPEVTEHDGLVGGQPGDVASRRRRADQHVGRLDVAMQLTGGVHVDEGGGDLRGDADGLPGIERATLDGAAVRCDRRACRGRRRPSRGTADRSASRRCGTHGRSAGSRRSAAPAPRPGSDAGRRCPGSSCRRGS